MRSKPMFGPASTSVDDSSVFIAEYAGEEETDVGNAKSVTTTVADARTKSGCSVPSVLLVLT
jgi:hypothetical protein